MLGIISLAIVCLTSALLGTFVLANNPKARLNRVFGTLVFLLPVWSIVVFLEDSPLGQGNIEILARADFMLAAAMIMLFYAFCRVLTHRGSVIIDMIVGAGTFISVILSAIGLTSTVSFQGDDLVLEPSIGFIPFGILLVVALLSALWALAAKYRHSTGKERAQITFIGLGALLSTIGIVLADIVAPRIFNIASPDVARLGVYSIIFLIAFSTYAIIRHRFMDLRTIAARSVMYALLLITLAAIYAIAAFQLGGLIFHDEKITLAREAYNVILALILAFTFQPLRRFFEKVTDRIFYRNRYDSQQVINEFSKVLVSELYIDRILKKALTYLCRSIHVEYGQLVVFNHDRVYKIEHYGPLPKRLMIVPELRRLNKALLVADELEDGEMKELMTGHGVRVSLELRTHEEHIGYLLLGDKLSGDIYSEQDLRLLEITSKELAVAISNAKAYDEIQAFNVTLQQRVEHATNRLRVANRHLKELDKAKDEFISMASHQLRTPLTTIKGYLSMLSEGDAGPLTAAQRDFVDYAFGSSERMVNLISDLLNVSRLSAGRFLIQARPTDMVHLIEDEVRQLQNHAINKGITLTFEAPDKPLPPAEIDDNKTRQVVMNFIDNAIYYTTEGGVNVHLEQTGDRVRLEVRDTGIGVPRASQRKLFTKFYRAENAQVIRPDGTGLGLYLARRVIEDQGGTIIFSSIEGKGSVFGFELPLSAAKPKTTKETHGKH